MGEDDKERMERKKERERESVALVRQTRPIIADNLLRGGGREASAGHLRYLRK